MTALVSFRKLDIYYVFTVYIVLLERRTVILICHNFRENYMDYSFIVRSGLSLTIITIASLIHSPVWAEISETIPQNLQQQKQPREKLKRQWEETSRWKDNLKQQPQQLWQQFRQQQDEQRLRQQLQLEQFRQQDELRLRQQLQLRQLRQQNELRLRQQSLEQLRQQELRLQQQQQLEQLRQQQDMQRQQPR